MKTRNVVAAIVSLFFALSLWATPAVFGVNANPDHAAGALSACPEGFWAPNEPGAPCQPITEQQLNAGWFDEAGNPIPSMGECPAGFILSGEYCLPALGQDAFGSAYVVTSDLSSLECLAHPAIGDMRIRTHIPYGARVTWMPDGDSLDPWVRVAYLGWDCFVRAGSLSMVMPVIPPDSNLQNEQPAVGWLKL